jgi:hypothetical protein
MGRDPSRPYTFDASGWPLRLAVSPLVHGRGTFHLIVANGNAPSKAPVLAVIAITKCRIWVRPSEALHSATRCPAPVWPYGRRLLEWRQS